VRDGKKNGERKLYDREGQVKLVENYVDGLLEGVQKQFDGKLLLSATSFKQGKKDGAELRYFPDGKVAEESTWVAGELTAHTVRWMNGHKRTARVQEGELWKHSTWHDNGQLHTEVKVRILRARELFDGPERRWAEDGVLLEERAWKSGKRDGLSKTFFPKTGKPLAEEEYQDDVRLSRKEWDEAGAVVKAERYNPDGSRQ
jgi:antitoxin component YwqK of YwqJK toxin-antitoxin module